MAKRFRVRGGRQSPAPARVRGPELRQALAKGRARAARHEGRYVEALEQVFRTEAKRVARRFEQTVTRHAMTAAAETSASSMVAVYPSLEQASALAQPNGEPVEIIHCTLAFLGETTIDQAEQVAALLADVAAEHGPLSGTVGGVASFGSETGVQAEVARVAGLVAPDGGYGETAWNAYARTVWWNPADWTSTEEAEAAEQAFLAIPAVEAVEIAEAESAVPAPEQREWVLVYANGRALVEPAFPSIALPDVPGLAELRHGVCEALRGAGVPYSELHGWTPHMTLAYLPEVAPPPSDLLGLPLSFDRVYLTRGDIPRGYLLGERGLVAAGEPPDWSPPHPDEVFRPERFADEVRGKTDPVRQAVIEDAVSAGIDLAGVAFDVTNPFVATVIGKTGAKVTEITETTRLGIMRTIGYAYDEGLSIPDTAKLLREAVEGASKWRSELIARTEMSGLVNGGSYAASRIVAEETGVHFVKRWLTAEGAKDPRHEDYDGLDGQEVELDEPFDVGGFALMYPGDPDGPAEEICNCRCTSITVEVRDGEPEVIDDESDAESGDGDTFAIDDLSVDLPDVLSVGSSDLLDAESINAVFRTEKDGRAFIVKPEPTGVLLDEDGEPMQLRENITPGKDLERERAAYLVSRAFQAIDPEFAVDTPPLRVAEVDVAPGALVRFDEATGEEVELPGGKMRAGVSEFVPDAEPASAVSSSVDFLAGEQAVRNAGLFDAVIGNTDRHGGNYLLDGRLATGTGATDHGRLWLIDHGLAFPEDNLAGYYNQDLMRQAAKLYGPGLDSNEVDFLIALRERLPQLRADLDIPDAAYAAMEERLDFMIRNETRLPPGYHAGTDPADFG